MIFQTKSAAKITANISGTVNAISLDGVNANETDPENAAAQMNVLLGIVGITVSTDKMFMTLKKEAVDNG